MINLTKIDHACLLVTDLERSKEYYEKLFGVVCKPHPNDHKILLVENSQVHFFLKQVEALLPDFIEEQHLSFEVLSIDCVIKELKSNDILSFETGSFTHFFQNNYKWLEWRDPDGIRLECIEKLI